MSAFATASFLHQLFQPDPPFDRLMAQLWAYQSDANPTLKAFAAALSAEGYPWEGPLSLPIACFKSFPVKTGEWEAKVIFESSGTTGQVPSRHHVRDLALYRRNTLRGFHHFFPAGKYRILALLPSYLERGHSSLVYMVQRWMEAFGTAGSGFFLHDFEALRQAIREAEAAGERILLIGVAFALLDLVENAPLPLPADSLVIETGGMKGRKEELTREALHARLQTGFQLPHIYSEYGMTEMMSQAYLGHDGRFRCPPSLRVWTSDLHHDGLKPLPGRAGA
jgi:phenylacetate-coenzyme A ligase PaaK-like adenylate-forming protein